MASADSTKPSCPVCNQSDQVKTMQAAYNSGVARCAPPDMPTRNVSMMKPITICGFFVGICLFLIITLIGGLENGFPQIAQLILLVITLVLIVTALAVSYWAFQRVVRGDNETVELFPAWDKATTRWNSLYYCQRDNVVFDPKTNEQVSNNQLVSLRASATKAIKSEMQAATQH
ncbi:hypothetical protein KDH_45750 [Dictyobacter sp. S3.2.2.5]|uniref:Uncharacterized protein n=1 Tax=Dictyobacter halimunensis TaxID=3026934 RepID=A0ABQ6FYZ6_9CHLR|nr:hypothetical protein KDH_45750 [Dictyobacter sp. S3.2.2.5]